MNKLIQTIKLQATCLSVIAALFLLAGTTTAEAQKIGARPLTPQEIHDYGLPEGTISSGGLMTVGIGEPVYLEAQVPKGTVTSGVVWSLESTPSTASTAIIMNSPLPGEMPIYSVGDREILDVAGRALLVPDVEGVYMVKAVISTTDGPIALEAQVTGALYVGVGTMDFSSPTYPQCALCHPGQAVDYMATGHASMFELAIDGLKSSHYNENCIDCHVLGKGPGDMNGSFFDVANQVGWTFPEVLEPGNWASMPDELQAMANIQCEHCHGAGSEHHGIKSTISVSLSSGDCAQCHDEEPYHNRNRQWDLSGHAVATRYPTGPGRGSCVECHSGIGFIEEMDGVAEKSTDYEAITCAACHDPHSAENEHQVRTMADIELNNGHVVTEGGTGKLCMNCHKGRRNAVEYVQGNVSRHFGPHYGVAGDLFNGTNAIDYGKVPSKPSGHLYALENSCASCHMQSVSGDAANMAGDHTFKMVWDNGTPENHSDDVDMVGACVDCHGNVTSFDDFTADFDYDGHAGPIQEEIHHLLEALALKLPPYGSPQVERDSGKYDYSDAEKKALFNYMCAEEDGSFGMHNPKYISGILQASINDLSDPFNAVLSGVNIPVGGEWFYSQWFEFYAPTQWEGWVYHYEHGYLKIEAREDGNIWIYDLNTKTWRYTTPELYPIMYVPADGTWVYYGGKYSDDRTFYNFATGKWSMAK
ncbi:hypothetical protein G0Q06_11605 [Puniceicoccales bacterium CK1056]|uniref:Uncharacterized protein n=1 Tax=Oceanipulchritudo coccoides TaxID=2706888 RepID=A0A6B2M5Z6_9BACT|nr:cytochrome c3 family protein [Oceanipulchritudo coccoides]NDV63100.1 hypothetical protein [Oceanipulchritudo coccoides]